MDQMVITSRSATRSMRRGGSAAALLAAGAMLLTGCGSRLTHAELQAGSALTQTGSQAVDGSQAESKVVAYNGHNYKITISLTDPKVTGLPLPRQERHQKGRQDQDYGHREFHEHVGPN